MESTPYLVDFQNPIPFRDSTLFFYWGVSILVSQHNFFSQSAVSNNFFLSFDSCEQFFLTKKLMNFCTKDSFLALIKDHPLVF